MEKLIFSFGVIFTGLATGYVIQILVRRGSLRLLLPIDDLRKLLQKIALLFVMPVTVLGAIWIVNIRDLSIAALPFIGFGAITLGMLLAFAAARLLRLPPRKTGALIPCGSFTNIGAVGALICFMFLGEKGFALVPVYKIFEELTYYSVGFPIAKFYSVADAGRRGTMDRVKGLAKDPFIIAAFSSLAIGGALNLAGVPRPAAFGTVNAVFIPAGTGMLLVSIGLAMRFRSVGSYLKECIAVTLIKFCIIPVTMTTIAWWIGYGRIEDGLPLKVVMILSSMPVAFNALIPPSIYDLDLDLANACWFFTTTGLIVILPLLQFALSKV